MPRLLFRLAFCLLPIVAVATIRIDPADQARKDAGLIRAVQLQYLERAESLIQSGASLDAKSEKGQGIYWIAVYGAAAEGVGPAAKDAHRWVFKQLSNRLATKELRDELFQTYYEEDFEKYHPLLRNFEFTFKLLRGELAAKPAPVAGAERAEAYRLLAEAVAIYSEAIMSLNKEGRLLEKPQTATKYSGAKFWSPNEDTDLMMQAIENYVVASAARLAAQRDSLNDSFVAHIFCMAEISWNLRAPVPRELALGRRLLEKLASASPALSVVAKHYRAYPDGERGKLIRIRSLPFMKNALGVTP